MGQWFRLGITKFNRDLVLQYVNTSRRHREFWELAAAVRSLSVLFLAQKKAINCRVRYHRNHSTLKHNSFAKLLIFVVSWYFKSLWATSKPAFLPLRIGWILREKHYCAKIMVGRVLKHRSYQQPSQRVLAECNKQVNKQLNNKTFSFF